MSVHTLRWFNASRKVQAPPPKTRGLVGANEEISTTLVDREQERRSIKLKLRSDGRLLGTAAVSRASATQKLPRGLVLHGVRESLGLAQHNLQVVFYNP